MDEQSQAEIASQALEADALLDEAHLGDASKGKDDEGAIGIDLDSTF